MLALLALLGTSMLGSIAPAAADPQAGQERPVSDLPVQGKNAPAVASNGTLALVVWSDYTAGPVAQIRAARRDSAGNVLSEIAVSPSPAAQTAPAVAFNGTNFFVVWEESGDLFGTRVTPAGAVLDAYGIPVAISRASDLSQPALASDGANFLVVWVGQDGDTGDAVFAKRITGTGALLDGPGFTVGSAGLYGAVTGGGPAVAFNGTSYLVAWSSDGCPFCGVVLGALVTTAGTVSNPGGVPLSRDGANQYFNEFAPAVSASGSQFVVAWTAERCTPPADCSTTSDSDVLAGRVDGTGTVVGTTNIAVATAAGFAGEASVASTGSTSLVAWSDSRTGLRDVYAARVSAAGAVVDPSGIRVSSDAAADTAATVTALGSAFVVGWRSGVDVDGASIDGTGAIVHAAALVSAGIAPMQTGPDVAWAGGQVVSVWRESRPGLPDTIRLGRSAPGGPPGSGEGTVIASGFDLGDPAIAAGGAQQLVVWHQDGKIYGARIELGASIDASPFVVSPSQAQFTSPQSPAVAWNGAAYLVAWADDDSGSLGIFGARVNQAATVLDPTGITIASAPGTQDFPAVASDGTDFLVAWHDSRNASGSDIYGTRITGAGVVSSPAGVLISAAAGAQANPDVAWNGTRYVAVWQDRRSGTSDDIYGARLSAAAVVADPAGIALSVASGDQTKPSVSVTGTDALVTWEDRRGGAAVDLYGARLSTAGAVRDPQGIPLSTATTDEVDPATVTASNGQVVVGYQRLAVGAPYRADRVFLRVVAPK